MREGEKTRGYSDFATIWKWWSPPFTIGKGMATEKNKAKLLIELFHMVSKFSGERRHMLLAHIFFKKKLMASEILLKNNLSALKDNHILVLS